MGITRLAESSIHRVLLIVVIIHVVEMMHVLGDKIGKQPEIIYDYEPFFIFL